MASRPAIEARRAKVATMLLAHRSTREIAAAIGVHHTTIVRDVQAIRAEWAERRRTAIDAWTAEEVAKLDAVERAIMPDVLKGSTWHVDRLLAAMHHRARLLGLYAPERHEVLTADTVDQAIAQLEAELAGDGDA